MMDAVAKFYLRRYISKEDVQSILKYIEDFGNGNASVEKEDGETILYIDDTRDFQLVKQTFPEQVDAQADLTRRQNR